MKEMRQTIAMGLLIAAFWGMLYPEFSLIEDTFICMEEEYAPDRELLAMLEGGREKIVFKSKLWELWKERTEKQDQSR